MGHERLYWKEEFKCLSKVISRWLMNGSLKGYPVFHQMSTDKLIEENPSNTNPI